MGVSRDVVRGNVLAELLGSLRQVRTLDNYVIT